MSNISQADHIENTIYCMAIDLYNHKQFYVHTSIETVGMEIVLS